MCAYTCAYVLVCSLILLDQKNELYLLKETFSWFQVSTVQFKQNPLHNGEWVSYPVTENTAVQIVGKRGPGTAGPVHCSQPCVLIWHFYLLTLGFCQGTGLCRPVVNMEIYYPGLRSHSQLFPQKLSVHVMVSLPKDSEKDGLSLLSPWFWGSRLQHMILTP